MFAYHITRKALAQCPNIEKANSQYLKSDNLKRISALAQLVHGVGTVNVGSRKQGV